MKTLYLVDGYNFILRNAELDAVVHEEGLAAARAAFREMAERLARYHGCRVRLIYDGAVDPMSHQEQFENAWIEVSFTSRDEKADERLVAVAAEARRRGVTAVVVSDDAEGVRQPLAAAGLPSISTQEFAQLLRPAFPEEELRGEALSEATRREIATEFLVRDAERQRRAALQPPPLPGGAARPPGEPAAVLRKPAAAPGGPTAARPQTPAAASATRAGSSSAVSASGASPQPNAAAEAQRAARKARGQRKQARRLALLQSRSRSR